MTRPQLDLPLVIWGADVQWNRDAWEWLVMARRDARLRDPARLRLNSYRVLLSRGRDGLVVVVPALKYPRLEATYDALRAAGMRELSLDRTT